jgi:hypothetical protein
MAFPFTVRGLDVVCDVREAVPDAGTVDLLARLLLATRHIGFGIRFEHASAELVELVDLMGLRDVLVLER